MRATQKKRISGAVTQSMPIVGTTIAAVILNDRA